ncbi:hypothetical protein D3C71_2077870 [compost metagenome]
MQAALLGPVFDGTAELHTPLVLQFAPGLAVQMGGFIVKALHGMSPWVGCGSRSIARGCDAFAKAR